MFHVTDWYPTLLGVFNKQPTGPPMDGVSEWKGLVDSSEEWVRNEMVYNIKTDDDHPYNPVSAIRVGDWKYLWRVTGDDTWQKPPEGREEGIKQVTPSDSLNIISHTNQLFNLVEDPLEEINLAYVEPERADEMKARLKDYLHSYMEVDYSYEDPAGKPAHFGDIWSTGWC